MRAISMEKQWRWPALLISSALVVLVVTYSNICIMSSLWTMFYLLPMAPGSSKLSFPPPVGPRILRLAYLVVGSKGDLERLWRMLLALYHPQNLYVVHLDLESPAREWRELAARVTNESLFAGVGNIRVIKKANMVARSGNPKNEPFTAALRSVIVRSGYPIGSHLGWVLSGKIFP